MVQVCLVSGRSHPACQAHTIYGSVRSTFLLQRSQARLAMQTLPAFTQGVQSQHKCQHAHFARASHRSSTQAPLAAPHIALSPCASQRHPCTTARAAAAQAADVAESASLPSDADSNGATTASDVSALDSVTLESGVSRLLDMHCFLHSRTLV